MINYYSISLKKLIPVLCFCLITTSLLSQSKIIGNKDVVIEQQDIEAFHTLNIDDDFVVVLMKSTYPSVTIETDSNLQSIVNFQVTDSVLNFQVSKIVKRAKEFKATIRYTEPLKAIILNGSVDLESPGNIDLKELSLTLNDDAKIDASIVTENFSLTNNNEVSLKLSTNCKLKVESKKANLQLNNNSNNIVEINTEQLNIVASDKAELDIEGFSYNLNVDISGSSELNGKELLSNACNIKLSEKAEASIQVTDTITISASGTSKLQLYGEPKITLENFSESASIFKKEL